MESDNSNVNTQIIGPGHMETPTPQIISLDDISNSIEVLKAKEQDYKYALQLIANLSYDTIRRNLIQWALQGYRNCFVIYEVPISVPDLCSDGVQRNLENYITFCSGNTIHELISMLQARMKDIKVNFAYSGYSILVNVSKLDT